MAVSIGGVLFEVGMNTNGYQAGAKRIEQIDMNLKNAIKRNHFETAQMAKELHKTRLEYDNIREQRRRAIAKLQRNDTAEQRKIVNELTKRRDKLADSYERQFKALKNVIAQNKMNVGIMRQEAEIAKQNIVEQSRLKDEYHEQTKARRDLGKLARAGLHFAGLGTAITALRQLRDAMYEAGLQALKLKRDAENGVVNPEAWSMQNIQLAKYGEGVETIQNTMKGWFNSLIGSVSVMTEMVSTGKSYNQILQENEKASIQLQDIAIRKARQKAIELELEKKIKELNEINTEYARTQSDYRWELLSDEEKISKLAEKQKTLHEQLNSLDKDSVEFAKAKLKFLNARIEREKLLKSVEKENLKEQEEKQREAKREQERLQKESEREAKRIADEQKRIALARQEFELQFKIAKLESGNERQKAQAEAIKNAIKRNELMRKYGYDIETATRALKAQRALENKGDLKYSEEDIQKAKRIVERGEKGSIGKKTLSQAQAILEGREIQGERVSLFDNARVIGRDTMQFDDSMLNTPQTSNIATMPITNNQSVAVQAQAVQPKQDILNKILETLNKMPEILGEKLTEVFSE